MHTLACCRLNWVLQPPPPHQITQRTKGFPQPSLLVFLLSVARYCRGLFIWLTEGVKGGGAKSSDSKKVLYSFSGNWIGIYKLLMTQFQKLNEKLSRLFFFQNAKSFRWLTISVSWQCPFKRLQWHNFVPVRHIEGLAGWGVVKGERGRVIEKIIYVSVLDLSCVICSPFIGSL